MKHLKIFPNKDAFEVVAYEIEQPFVVLTESENELFYSEHGNKTFEYRTEDNRMYYTSVSGDTISFTGEVITGNEYDTVGKLEFNNDITDVPGLDDPEDKSQIKCHFCSHRRSYTIFSCFIRTCTNNRSTINITRYYNRS